MNEAMIVAFLVFVLAAIWIALRHVTKALPPPEEDEHAQMVKPRDKQGRWVREGDGLVSRKGPGAPYQRRKK